MKPTTESALCPLQHIAYFLGGEILRAAHHEWYGDMEIVDGWRARTFTIPSQRPALICKTIEAVVTDDQMVEQPYAQ